VADPTDLDATRRDATPLEEQIRTAARSLGFDQIGFAPAEPPRHAAEYEAWLAEGHHGEMAPMNQSRGDDHAPSTHGEPSPLMPFAWPVEGYMRGFQVSVIDEDGQELPRHILHHMIGVNFERRQLAYPVPERFFGIGTETEDVQLPGSLGLPLVKGQELGFYASWHNDTGRDIRAAYIRVAMDYEESGSDGLTPILPVYLDTNNEIGGSNMFTVEPGRTEKEWQFELPVSGKLLAATGHLHDYGEHVRLEDVETGEVLVRLDAIKDEGGKLEGVERKIFRKWLGLRSDPVRLEAGYRYRVVGVYDSPETEPIVDGAMAHIVGIFVPDDLSAWPALDKESEMVKLDLSGLPPRLGAHKHQGH